MILFIGHDATRTGAPTSLLTLLRWLREHTDWEMEVLLGRGGPLENAYREVAPVHLWEDPKNDNPEMDLLSRARRKLSGERLRSRRERRRKALCQRLTKKGINCIFNNTGVNGHLLEALRAFSTAPVVSRIPELEAYMRKNNRRGSARKVLQYSDHFIAVSRAVMDNLVQRYGIPEQQITLIPGVTGEKRIENRHNYLRDTYDIPENAFLVGGCGTMDWRKGIDLFIQVAWLTKRRHPDTCIHFFWFGAPVSFNTGVEYRYEVELLELEDRLHLTGKVEDSASCFAGLDLFLLTSREDPFPLVMLESARQGVPIICFDKSGGAPEFIDEEVGAVVPLPDTGAMVNELIQLYRESDRRQAMAEAIFKRSLDYTPERAGANIRDLIQQLAARRLRDEKTG